MNLSLTPPDPVSNEGIDRRIKWIEEKVKNKYSLDFISFDYIKDQLDVSKKSLTRWIKDGLIRQYKVRGKVFYKITELNNVIRENETTLLLPK